MFSYLVHMFRICSTVTITRRTLCIDNNVHCMRAHHHCGTFSQRALNPTKPAYNPHQPDGQFRWQLYLQLARPVRQQSRYQGILLRRTWWLWPSIQLTGPTMQSWAWHLVKYQRQYRVVTDLRTNRTRRMRLLSQTASDCYSRTFYIAVKFSSTSGTQPCNEDNTYQ